MPSTASPPSAAAPVIGAKMMFLIGRFIALAMSWVSSMPEAPTTMPATISAGLPITKPLKPTARPVRALYREMTTGMSAPPIGTVISTPKTRASTKNAISIVEE